MPIHVESCYADAIGKCRVRFNTPLPDEQFAEGISGLSMGGDIFLPISSKLENPRIVCSVLRDDGSEVESVIAEHSIREPHRISFGTNFRGRKGKGWPELRHGLYIAKVELYEGNLSLAVATSPLQIVKLALETPRKQTIVEYINELDADLLGGQNVSK